LHLPQFEYLRPATLDDALALLGQAGDKAAILAGGTDLMANLSQRLTRAEQLISIRSLDELRGVSLAENGAARIGAGTTLTEIAGHAGLAAAQPLFIDAVNAVASVHVRNMATLGGNLALPTRCWYTNQTETWRNARAGCYKTDRDACHVLASSERCVATSSADTVPALIVLDAEVVLQSVRGERRVPLAGFYRNDGAEHILRDADELITAVEIPACHDRCAFVKVTPREGIDFGLGNIAVRIAGPDDKLSRVHIVVNSLGVQPMRLRAAEAALLEQGLTDKGIEYATRVAREDLGEITSLWSPAGYKRRLVRTLLRRSLQRIRDGEPGAAAA
jgi:4-hydroxybenzoyl-CoA reductase beta subunit